MITAADTYEEAQRLARALVKREARERGKMIAYDIVARRVDASPRWLQRLLGRSHVHVAAHQLDNLRRLYVAACERLETDAERDKRAFRAIGDGTHAADTSARAASVVGGPAGDPPGASEGA